MKNMDSLNTNTVGLINSLLDNLPSRSKEVLVRRFGIENNKKETLQSIGDDFGVTRERVRQIQETAIKQFKQIKGFESLKDVFNNLKIHFKEHGDLRRETKILCDDGLCLFSGFDEAPQGIMRFLLELGDEFYRYPEKINMHSCWTIDHMTYQGVEKILKNLVKRISKEGRVFSRDELLALLEEIIFELDRKEILKNKINLKNKEKKLFSWLDVSKEISFNIYGEYGLSYWPEISPKNVKSKIYLVLKRKGKPLHFSEIVNLINESAFDKKRVNLQTVHNELIRDERFVLIGRGIYALVEWGYRPGTVKDIIISILEKRKTPLPLKEIIKKVLEQRQVKEDTIILNLKDKNLFIKSNKGYYLLKR